MPRRYNDHPLEHDLPKKRISHPTATQGPKEHQTLVDILGSQWKLGKAVGIGGFGEIYLASSKQTATETQKNTQFVAKIEPHSNGPLFVEINCYLRIAKPEHLNQWIADKRLKYLGIPCYIASGSHQLHDERYRFLILPRFDRDLESILKIKEQFNVKTVLTIAKEILNVLEYIHSHGYVHSDIKASNIMLGGGQTRRSTRIPVEGVKKRSKRIETTRISPKKTRRKRGNLRHLEDVNYLDDIPYLEEILRNFEDEKAINAIVNERMVRVTGCEDEVYLIDYGLACKYRLSNGKHRKFDRDERKAHAGTLMFCSRDAHYGAPSRRSDMESLAYNMIYWLTGFLPWAMDIDQPETVEKKKIRCIKEYKTFLECCFGNQCPKFMVEFLRYLNSLGFEDKPDYNFCRTLFKKALKENGFKDDSRLDFDNVVSSQKTKVIRGKCSNGRENRMINERILNGDSMRPPLVSNIIYKRPKLRKKTKDQQPICDSMMNWSKILTDPENILKQGSKKRSLDEASGCDDEQLSEIDLGSMNPTYAMLEVYNNYMGKGESRKYEKMLDGYTPAMMDVHLRKLRKSITVKKRVTKINRISRVVKKAKESPTKKCSTKSKSLPSGKKDGRKKILPRHRYSLRG